MVFDCGVLPNWFASPNSNAMRAFVAQRIGLAMPKEILDNHTIDAVFLSHLHEDHVNGLDELKRQGIRIKRVYYPAIEEADRDLMFVWYQVFSQDGGLAQKLCMNQPTSIPDFDDTQWIPVPPGVPEEQERDAPNTDAILLDNIQEQNIPLSTWEFLTFNFKSEAAIKALNNAWSAAGFSGNLTNSNLMREWNTPSGRNRVRQVYETAFAKKHFNTNSMTLFSGPHFSLHPMIQIQNGKSLVLKSQNGVTELSPLGFPAGCLYTGDYNTSTSEPWAALKKAYERRWTQIGCLQVPHHGSIQSFNRELINLSAVFVASMGSDNRYDHPSPDVEKEFNLVNKKLLHVTENLTSKLVLKTKDH